MRLVLIRTLPERRDGGHCDRATSRGDGGELGHDAGDAGDRGACVRRRQRDLRVAHHLLDERVHRLAVRARLDVVAGRHFRTKQSA